jgi:hypothetical protein
VAEFVNASEATTKFFTINFKPDKHASEDLKTIEDSDKSSSSVGN